MILVDSNFLIALFISNDALHDKAAQIANEVYNQDKAITDLFISETITLIIAKSNAKASKEVYHHILKHFKVIEVDRTIYNETINTVLKYRGILSFADSLGVKVMKEKGMNKIASFDTDFDIVQGIQRIY
ncbi:MAG: type II toxin-antitoxin system VapC family toxin [Methanobrevibacter sp.]|jgi:predicted nucleic acid-binding protein|nr:type II toxin-antitoxin system VapC family toxin [Candidatus Methanoflexus mossambicus]